MFWRCWKTVKGKIWNTSLFILGCDDQQELLSNLLLSSPGTFLNEKATIVTIAPSMRRIQTHNSLGCTNCRLVSSFSAIHLAWNFFAPATANRHQYWKRAVPQQRLLFLSRCNSSFEFHQWINSFHQLAVCLGIDKHWSVHQASHSWSSSNVIFANYS